jgi:hypothetical protein
VRMVRELATRRNRNLNDSSWLPQLPWAPPPSTWLTRSASVPSAFHSEVQRGPFPRSLLMQAWTLVVLPVETTSLPVKKKRFQQ